MAGLDLKLATKADLLALIENKIFENSELEYKDYTFVDGKIAIADKSRDKFVKEIAAFANTNGGIIVIGMQEDDNRFPTKLSGTGMTLGDFDNWLSSFRQLLLSRIRPHLHGVECTPVSVDGDQNIAIVISIPRSIARPHSFWDGNKDEFYMRYANGIMYMDIGDLRKAFLYSSGLQDKIRQFKRDRISLILANECIGDLGNKAKLVFHIIPEWSFELGNGIDLSYLEGSCDFRPLSGSSWNHRYNADGYCIYSGHYKGGLIETYTQFFHSGIVEATEIRLISDYQEKIVYDWNVVQGAMIEALKRYCAHLEHYQIPKPWHFSAALLNARGYITYRNWGNSEPIERDIVYSQEGICTDDISIDKALESVFDSLSNAFGYRASGFFDR